MGTSSNSLDLIFAALSDPTRREILAQLIHDEKSLSDLAAPFDITQTAVSKHVRVLVECRLVEVEKRGRTRYCALNPSQMETASEWLEQYRSLWLRSFDNLGRYLNEERKKPGAKKVRKSNGKPA